MKEFIKAIIGVNIFRWIREHWQPIEDNLLQFWNNYHTYIIIGFTVFVILSIIGTIVEHSEKRKSLKQQNNKE
jgi:hypothetical protein